MGTVAVVHYTLFCLKTPCTLCSHYVQWLLRRSLLVILALAPGRALGGFALDLHHESPSVNEEILCCPSVLVLHRLQSHKRGQNIPTMPETCASSAPRQLMGSRAALKMLCFGLEETGSVYLPWLHSGIFLCGLNAAQSLAQGV